MNMSEFSSLVELSPHTLRYYEKIGLLKNVQRNSSGHRMYSSMDFKWISFIKRLKETAMPLEEILEYAKLREVGSESVMLRKILLEQHKENLRVHIDQQQKHLQALEDKINLYKSGKVD